MICIDSKKTIEILLNNISYLKEKWGKRPGDVFLPLTQEYRHHIFNETNHNLLFKTTGKVHKKPINILFSHFSLMKYEMEAIEMPLYASKVFPNSNIDMCYFDSRGRVSNVNTHYLASTHNGNITRPKGKDGFLDHYDIMITRSSTINRMRKQMPNVLNSCRYKVNIQTNNYAPCLHIGEDYAFCYTEFFAPAGNKFLNRAKKILDKNLGKMNLIVMTGSIVWWKGQAEWIENIDADLLKDCVVLVLGNISNNQYFHKLITAAANKNINLLYSSYVNPKFLCDVLCFSRVKVMNHYMDAPAQPAIGPSRTFGEAVTCHNICLQGQTYDKDNKIIGKTSFVPHEWHNYTIEYDQANKQCFNDALEKALTEKYREVDFSSQITMEEKCDQVFEKCLSKYKELENESN